MAKRTGPLKLMDCPAYVAAFQKLQDLENKRAACVQTLATLDRADVDAKFVSKDSRVQLRALALVGGDGMSLAEQRQEIQAAEARAKAYTEANELADSLQLACDLQNVALEEAHQIAQEEITATVKPEFQAIVKRIAGVLSNLRKELTALEQWEQEVGEATDVNVVLPVDLARFAPAGDQECWAIREWFDTIANTEFGEDLS